eukprot:PITA_33111
MSINESPPSQSFPVEVIDTDAQTNAHIVTTANVRQPSINSRKKSDSSKAKSRSEKLSEELVKYVGTSVFTLGSKLPINGIHDIFEFGPTLKNVRMRKCYRKATGQTLCCKSYLKNYKEEFLNEAYFMYYLQEEPGIVKPVAGFEEKQFFNLIMEFCPGGDLSQLVVKKGNYVDAEAEAVAIFRQIMEALDRCHRKGVMHRDIKLSNIFLSSTTPPVVKLGDFGLSTEFEKGNVFYEPIGTPQYRAPEIVASNGYCEAVDVWSAGVLLYKMLVGVYPFGPHGRQHSGGTLPLTSEETTKLWDDILNKHLDFTVDHWSQISESARDLVSKLLVKNPEARLTVTEV